MLFRNLLFGIVFIAFPALAQAAVFATYEKERAAEIITLNVGDVGSYKAFFLSKPERLVVDVPFSSLPSIPQPQDSALIGAARVGRFNATTLRVVFELKTKCTLVDKALQSGELSLTLAAERNAPPPPPPKPLVIIDPGHGGDDPGAIGPKDSQEKDIVLTFSKALEEALLKSGKYRVQLTRESDVFVPLRERVAFARKAGGTIFISIHADSAPKNSARGLSVYTLSEKASDAEAEALADRENKSDMIGGMDLSNEREDVADILISLAQRDTRNQSALLADMLVISLGKQVRVLNNTHRFAGFAVLKAPDIPSVLVETGFISNPAEEKLLKTKQYREKLVRGLVEGIDRFFAKRGVTTP